MGQKGKSDRFDGRSTLITHFTTRCLTLHVIQPSQKTETQGLRPNATEVGDGVEESHVGGADARVRDLSKEGHETDEHEETGDAVEDEDGDGIDVDAAARDLVGGQDGLCQGHERVEEEEGGAEEVAP